MEVIILAEEKRNKNEIDEKYSSNLNPDDLDVREENDMTNEQKKNSPEAKLHDEKGSSSSNKQN
jgi:hypothetical protein